MLLRVQVVATKSFLAQLRGFSSIAVLCLLAACASHYNAGTSTGYRAHYSAPTRYYPPPGPPNDPWGPYIRDASARYGVPDQWIRAVMRQESGGREQVVSSAGAMGLMQLMPATYDTLRRRYGLGDDPFEPRDNIAAGTAYLREMYDRFGSPGFLAAYNAGPNRLDRYLSGDSPLPDETVNYVASIAPRLGNSVAMTGPLAVFAQGSGPVSYAALPVAASFAPQAASVLTGGCNQDAAYDPDAAYNPTCASTAPPVAAPVIAAPVVAAAPSAGGCDPDAAYDPSNRCPVQQVAAIVPAAPIMSQPLPNPPMTVVPTRNVVAASAPASVAAVAPAGGDWAIQLGAFSASSRAQVVAMSARDAMADLLGGARIELSPTTPFGGAVVYRARLSHISASAANAACARLSGQQQPCIIIAPGQAL